MSPLGTHDISAACGHGGDAFDAALSRRIYRAYQNLQRARVDGNYARIVRWKLRVDELLDAQMPATTNTAANPPAEQTPRSLEKRP